MQKCIGIILLIGLLCSGLMASSTEQLHIPTDSYTPITVGTYSVDFDNSIPTPSVVIDPNPLLTDKPAINDDAGFNALLSSSLKLAWPVPQENSGAVQLFQASILASALEAGVSWTQVYAYLDSGRIHPTGTVISSDKDGKFLFFINFSSHYQLRLYGEPITTAELYVTYEDFDQYSNVFPLCLSHTSHVVPDLDSTGEEAVLPCLSVYEAAPTEDIYALADDMRNLAESNTAFADSSSYAMLQYGLFVSCLNAEMSPKNVKEIAAHFPALSSEKLVEDNQSLSWWYGHAGHNYLKFFCNFEQGHLSQTGFTFDTYALSNLTLPDRLYDVAGTEGFQSYIPVVYLDIPGSFVEK